MLVFLVDEVEALAATGDCREAREALAMFEERTAATSSPWAEPLILRCRGLIHAAEQGLEPARTSLQAAIVEEEALPLPLERARTWLELGRVLRRSQRRAAAHEALEHARSLFDDLGAALWSQRAQTELARIGGRTASPHELTPTESRIAHLVAEGMTNREVAAALFVTPKTVESTLTRIYRKLGVRSRTELARRYAGT
jgi:DNA-binding CsgD family transcriptional regulator